MNYLSPYNGIALSGLTFEEENRLAEIDRLLRLNQSKKMAISRKYGDGLSQYSEKDSALYSALNEESAILFAEKQALLKKKNPYGGMIKTALKAVAMGICYQRTNSFVKAIGAGIFPYPYLAYVVYDNYIKKNKKRSNPRKKKARRK